jgi:NADPH-dependent 2,4-dienoyl-CoA reductase/sulfur reductase-like enzyme
LNLASSATAAETLRLEGAEGSVVIVSAEDRIPYHRPPLSGRLKLAEPREPPLVLREEDYRARRIELLRGVRLVGGNSARSGRRGAVATVFERTSTA